MNCTHALLHDSLAECSHLAGRWLRSIAPSVEAGNEETDRIHLLLAMFLADMLANHARGETSTEQLPGSPFHNDSELNQVQHAVSHLIAPDTPDKQLPLIDLDSPPLAVAEKILLSDDQTLSGILHTVEVLTGFGRQPLPNTWQLAGDALMSIALEQFRRYDLQIGCRTLRAAAYAGSHGIGLSQGVRFVLGQQNSEGTFGFVAGQLAESYIPSDPLVVSVYSLPVTLACLWTLAELGGSGFRLATMKKAEVK